MIKLTYTRENDPHQYVTVIGDPEGIRDLYWQLTYNYRPVDGTKIGTIFLTNLEGDKITALATEPYAKDTRLSNLDG